MGRLSRPLNSAAVKAADDEFYANHSELNGRPLSATDPLELRKEWVKLYKKHGGKEEEDEKPPPKKPDEPAEPCPKPCSCTITSQTIAKSPADRTRTLIGVGEEVELTVNPGSATWEITSGTGKLSPKSGTKVTYTADDKAGGVTITAKKPGCSCTITLTVVQPSSVSMERKAGTNLQHTHGWPDCGWRGKQWIHPDDVNFYRIERREVDSQAVCTGSYMPFKGDYHGNYAGGFGPWSGVNDHDPNKGSQAAMTDRIYSGYTGAAATGKAPPFNVGTMYFPIVYQWRVVGNTNIHDFPAIQQEHEIFSDGKCESRKGGNTESCMYDDPTSTP